MTWSLADVPDQHGRTAVVTGPSIGGLGYFTSLELARRGARVVLAGRSRDKLDSAAQDIRAEVPDADLVPLVVDLADLGSVRRAAEEAGSLGPLHVLVNNAGIMAPPYRRTADGLEAQMATNHFGPFLLTGLLLPQLRAAGGGAESGDGAGDGDGAGAGAGDGDARVVTVSSVMHRVARSAPLGDPLAARRYRRWPVYAQSKLANLLFTFELERRARQAGLPVRAVAAHPGISASHLVANGQVGASQGRRASILHAAVSAVSQSPAAGAWPILMAATADLPGATYVGPSGPGELSGIPQVVTCTALARDEVAQRRLWELSEETVGLRWP